jgi:hypothetical protein
MGAEEFSSHRNYRLQDRHDWTGVIARFNTGAGLMAVCQKRIRYSLKTVVPSGNTSHELMCN